jgi:hypothetical protein
MTIFAKRRSFDPVANVAIGVLTFYGELFIGTQVRRS